MIKAVIFDMFETLITHFESPLYMAKQICADIGITETKFREIWDVTDLDRTLGKKTLEEVIEEVLKKNDRYSLELFEMPSGAIVYDEESDEIRAATTNDIKAYSKIHDENKTSLVFICTTWGQNVSFVIYNFE